MPELNHAYGKSIPTYLGSLGFLFMFAGAAGTGYVLDGVTGVVAGIGVVLFAIGFACLIEIAIIEARNDF